MVEKPPLKELPALRIFELKPDVKYLVVCWRGDDLKNILEGLRGRVGIGSVLVTSESPSDVRIFELGEKD